MRELQKTAKDAYQAGAIELYPPTLTSGPLPLPSSLLASFSMPGVMPFPANVHTVAETLRQSGADITGHPHGCWKGGP
ncbi:hypothetical protein SUDANB146_02355 [Streptomyces sp. enrichment culture]